VWLFCFYVYCTLTEVLLNRTEVFLNRTEVFLNRTEVFLNRTEVSPFFFLSCKANARVKLAKMGHGPHPSTLVVICFVRLLFVLFCVLFVCKCVLPPGDNPIAVNKYTSIYHVLLLFSLSITLLLSLTLYPCKLLYKSVTLAIPPKINYQFNPLNPELNPICYLLALLGAHQFLHVSRIKN